MDRGAWWATVYWFEKVGHDLVTKQQLLLLFFLMTFFFREVLG